MTWALCGAVAWAAGGHGACAAPAASLRLEDCRLEHPLRLDSITARCGVLRVPEDAGAPAGRAIDLHVAVVPALDRRSAAPPLFLLAGGPGQSAIDLYTAFAGAFAGIHRSHDIVLLDQRGTGRSAPLDCDYPDDLGNGGGPGHAAVHSDINGDTTATDTAQLRRATQECLAKFGDRVRHYTTSVAVQDLDAVRRALGYGVLDLYAASYGTRVAQLYMRRHPQAVHVVILDGVLYPEEIIGPQTPLDGERALALILARCGESRACATTYPRLGEELDGLRRRFGPGRVALTLDDADSGLPRTVEFDRDLLNGALRLLSYGASQAALLPVLIHQAAAGNLAPLAAQPLMMTRRIGDQLASGMQNSVICSEDQPGFSAADDRAAIQRTYQGTDQLDAFDAICRLWPKGPVDADLHAPLHSDIPTLLLSGEADPVTPPAAAERAAAGLTHHRHLVLAGEGHGQLATGCVPRLMAQFLATADPARLDAGCLAGHRPPPFFVKLTGPAP